MKTYAALFILAFLTSYLSTPILRWLSVRWGLLDSSFTPGPHERRPVPRLGGVAIYLALLVALLALYFPANVIAEKFRAELPTLWLLAGPATLMLLLGAVDDIRGMKAWVKFGWQLVAALWLVAAGVSITRLSMPWGAMVELGALSIPVTLLWLVGLTNAFNLIDGLDGLAAGVAFLSASAIAVTAAMVDDKIVVVVTVALAGALLGFLRHNFSPATIFLGDSGSLFIGFVLAGSAIVWQQKTTTAIAMAAPLVAFGLPVADTAVSMVRRYLRGQPIFISDRQHIHHRLLALGFTPRQAVLILYAVCGLAALGCILIARGHNAVTAMVLVLFIGACWFGLRRLSYPEFAEFSRAVARERWAARGRLAESRQKLGLAGSVSELGARLETSAAVLQLDQLEVCLEPTRRARWQLPADEPLGRTSPDAAGTNLWRLTVPAGPGCTLVLGRDPQRADSALPLEELGAELGSAVAEVLARLDGQGGAPAANSLDSAPLWASSGKSQG